MVIGAERLAHRLDHAKEKWADGREQVRTSEQTSETSEKECECIGMSRTVEVNGRFGLHEHSGTGRRLRTETNTGRALGRETRLGMEITGYPLGRRDAWKRQLGARWDGTVYMGADHPIM